VAARTTKRGSGDACPSTQRSRLGGCRRIVARPVGGGSTGAVSETAAAPFAEPSGLVAELRAFAAFGAPSREGELVVGDRRVPTFTNEFWTAAQREGHSLHEVSYRACFKPSLPAFFIDRLSRPGELVFDPFMGRGTTPLEALLRGRVPCGNDINPLSAMLVRPRLRPPTLPEVIARLDELDLRHEGPLDDDLLVFFHPDTLHELLALREHLLTASHGAELDPVDDWIRMVAVNRLTGHSPGFFSVYTLPPNQATSAVAQRKINQKRNQVPPPRDVRSILAKKSKSLLADTATLWQRDDGALLQRAVLSTGPANAVPRLATGSVQLVVTSPPFLDIVQYAADNWLRCWFCGIDAAAVPITMARTVPAWQAAMGEVFTELHRVVRRGGHVAFEVGEVKGGSIRLEEAVVPVAIAAGFEPLAVMLHTQKFTKTANCWGVGNNSLGTNTNRIVVLQRP
jgi:hypothetical protein